MSKDQKPSQPPHPGDTLAANYIKTISDAGWQIHRAYRQGFDAGAVQVLVAQAQSLAHWSESQDSPFITASSEFKKGIMEAAKYLHTISQGGTYAFEEGPEPKDHQQQHPSRGVQGQGSEAGRGSRNGKGKAIQAQA